MDSESMAASIDFVDNLPRRRFVLSSNNNGGAWEMREGEDEGEERGTTSLSERGKVRRRSSGMILLFANRSLCFVNRAAAAGCCSCSDDDYGRWRDDYGRSAVDGDGV